MKGVVRKMNGEDVATFEDSATALLSLPAIARAMGTAVKLLEIPTAGFLSVKPASKALPLPRGCYWEGSAIIARP